MRFLLIIITLFLLVQTQFAQGQEQSLDDQEILNIENLYKNNPPMPKPVLKTTEALSQSEQKEQTQIKKNVEVQNSKIRNLTDLNKLAPFQDISVIQKKFLPKAERLQIFTAAALMTNSPWFINLGVKINLAYHFTEALGIEVSGMFLTSSESEAAKEIRTNIKLEPNKFIVTKYNTLIDFVWSPIYGKVSNTENEIIPFDMYFSFGGGMSHTNSREGSVPTIHMGTGQIFALSKSMAFRWDYSWNFYQATPEAEVGATAIPTKNSFNDLIFTAGVSFFFPEASYR